MNLNFLHKIIKDKSGATIMLVSILILTAILTITLTAGEITRLNLVMGRNQAESTKAYFAAEAGAERLLWEIMKNNFNYSLCGANQYINFSTNPATCANAAGFSPLANGATYQVRYITNLPLTFHSYGYFKDVRRRVELSF